MTAGFWMMIGLWLIWPFRPAPSPPAPPAVPTAPSVTEGARLYHRACLSCHGPRGNGDPLVLLPNGAKAPALADLSPKDWSRERLYQVIRQGAGPGMPGWAAVMNRREMESLALYVKSVMIKDASPAPHSTVGYFPKGSKGHPTRGYTEEVITPDSPTTVWPSNR